MCRIEIGNSAHRLEMSAWILSAPDVVEDSILPALLLALIAAILTVSILVAGKYALAWCTNRQKRELNQCSAHDAELSPALRIHVKA